MKHLIIKTSLFVLCDFGLGIASENSDISKRNALYGIGDNKIPKQAQEIAVNGPRQTDLSCNAVVEVRQHTLAVNTLRSGSQPQQNAF